MDTLSEHNMAQRLTVFGVVLGVKRDMPGCGR